jgi:hypothetical protein
MQCYIRLREDSNILCTIKRIRAFLIGHIFCKKYLLKRFIKRQILERIQVTRRRGRRGKQLLNDLKENGEYWKLKKEALYGTHWGISFGTGYVPDVKTDWRMNE